MSAQPAASEAPAADPIGPGADHDPSSVSQPKRKTVSFRFFSLSVRKTISPEEHEKLPHTTTSLTSLNGVPITRFSRSERRALKSALILRSVISGTPPKPLTSSQLKKIKKQLLKPKNANKIITQLKSLPTAANDAANDGAGMKQGPIRAVCLAETDDEMENKHFSTLSENDEKGIWSLAIPGVPLASLNKLIDLFNQLHVVDLIRTPDFGFGQPGDGPGLLAGAVPSAKTVLDGIEQITPQLMALGYTTGRAVFPDHTGVYPPKDRMSVITYWWGLEIVLPPPSLAFLGRVQSIPNTVVNMLTALALMNEGVREILPFVRYFAQYIEYQFKAIQAQDKGKGVVCASTWIMPAALVPRPWDFPDPPENKPAKDPAQDPAKDPAKDPTKDPAKNPTKEPVKEKQTIEEKDVASADPTDSKTPVSPQGTAPSQTPASENKSSDEEQVADKTAENVVADLKTSPLQDSPPTSQ